MSFGSTARRFSRTDKSGAGGPSDNIADGLTVETSPALDLRPYRVRFQFEGPAGTVKVEALGPRNLWTVLTPSLSVVGSPVYVPTYPIASFRWTYTGTGGFNQTEYELELR